MTDTTSSRRIGLLRAAAALLLLLMIGAGLAVWWNHDVSFAWTVASIEAEIKSWGNWAVAASIALMILHSLIPFPAEFISMANGMLFGAFWGVVITWTGAMLGAALAFALARWFGRPFVTALMNERQRETTERWLKRQGIGVLLLSRLMPLISFNVINYAAGLTPISWWTFLWTTALGILPITILLVVTGDQVWNGSGRTWLYLLAVGALGAAIWFFFARRQRAEN